MTRTVFANNRSFSHQGSGDQSLCSTPDICKTPVGSATPPIPYPVSSQARDASGYTTTVEIDGNPTAIASSSHTRCTGDEFGSAKGLISGTTGSKTEFITNSFDVKCEGEGVVRHMDLTTMNNANTLGVLYGTATSPAVVTERSKEDDGVIRRADLAATNSANALGVPHETATWTKGGTERVEEVGEGVFIDFYITDFEEEQRIEETSAGERIWLNVRTRNLIGDCVDIELVEQSHTFRYSNNIVTSDTFKGYQINSDHEKIELYVDERRDPNDQIDRNSDFSIAINLSQESSYFSPLGINAPGGKAGEAYLYFKIDVQGRGLDEFTFEVIDNFYNVIYACSGSNISLSEVVLTASKTTSNKVFEEKDPENIASYPPGVYRLKWDGFDSSNLYDSAKIVGRELRGRVKAKSLGVEKIAKTKSFKLQYSQVKWLDIRIDREQKTITSTVRVAFSDGGCRGIETEHVTFYPGGPNYSVKDILPGSRVSERAISKCGNLQPLTERTKSFQSLVGLAMDGLREHWGRNSKVRSNSVGKNICIQGDEYEFHMEPIFVQSSEEHSLTEMDLIFNTNKSSERSRNLVRFFSRQHDPFRSSTHFIAYNVGYLYRSNWREWDRNGTTYKNEGWIYEHPTDADSEFKETAAHEIGHEILAIAWGYIYSFQHKGSSTLDQCTKPAGLLGYPGFIGAPNYLDQLWFIPGENEPEKGEIDLMKYYNNERPASKTYDRTVASESDVIGLISLGELEIEH